MATVIRGDDNFDSADAGKVLQVVRNYTANQGYISTTSATFVASGILVTITPTQIGSEILVDYGNTMNDVNSGGQMIAQMRINGSEMAGSSSYHAGYWNRGYMQSVFGGSYTTTSTSPITFELYFRRGSGTAAYIAHTGGSNHITATEVGA
jgi:hypothetical protein|tara:strand:- start:579 stop:1031 length:453 start_codon:yes stop_codon:yes gene_type:complete